MCQNARFCICRMLKIDFTKNLSDRKFIKFPYCVPTLKIVKIQFHVKSKSKNKLLNFHTVICHFTDFTEMFAKTYELGILLNVLNSKMMAMISK